jgi:hypothetical protein
MLVTLSYHLDSGRLLCSYLPSSVLPRLRQAMWVWVWLRITNSILLLTLLTRDPPLDLRQWQSGSQLQFWMVFGTSRIISVLVWHYLTGISHFSTLNSWSPQRRQCHPQTLTECGMIVQVWSILVDRSIIQTSSWIYRFTYHSWWSCISWLWQVFFSLYECLVRLQCSVFFRPSEKRNTNGTETRSDSLLGHWIIVYRAWWILWCSLRLKSHRGTWPF